MLLRAVAIRFGQLSSWVARSSLSLYGFEVAFGRCLAPKRGGEGAGRYGTKGCTRTQRRDEDTGHKIRHPDWRCANTAAFVDGICRTPIDGGWRMWLAAASTCVEKASWKTALLNIAVCAFSICL